MTDDSGGSRRGDPSGLLGWVRWFFTADEGTVVYVRDVLTSVGIVLLVGLSLFAVSGVWPPMVAVESGSMEPNLERGDLVFIVEEHRFVAEGAPTDEGRSTGVVPASRATDYMEFGRPGDVIVFLPDGTRRGPPVIHRAMLWVEADENWYDRADPDYIAGADDCAELRHCPAPHAGFVTKGDNAATNPYYDQVSSLSAPVRPAWIVGRAEFAVPYLGHVRLLFSQVAADSNPGRLADPRPFSRPERDPSPGPEPTVPPADRPRPVA